MATPPAPHDRPAEAERVKLWDPWLRGFHWLLAVLVIVTFLLGKFGPLQMWLHFWLGYTIAALLVFRLVWGVVGPPPARFASFVRGPRAVAGYLRHVLDRRPSYWPGHNPVGAFSVIALLVMLAWQIGTGLISDPDDYINVGPLASEVSRATRRAAVGWHHLGSNIVLVLVILHVSVILFYRFWKHEDLVRPMIDGWKWVIRR